MASLRAKSRLLWHLLNASRCRVSSHALKVTSGGERIGESEAQVGFGAKIQGFEAQRRCIGTPSCAEEEGDEGSGDEGVAIGERIESVVLFGGNGGLGLSVRIQGFESCFGTERHFFEKEDSGSGDEKGRRRERISPVAFFGGYSGLGFGAEIRVSPLDTQKSFFGTKNWPQGKGDEGSGGVKGRGRERSSAVPFFGSNDSLGFGARISFDSQKRFFSTKTSSFSSSEESGSESGSESDSGKGASDRKPRERDVKWHVDRLCPTSLRVRLMKELDFDDIIEREKKLKIVLKIKDLLMADPSRTMELQDLGKCRDFVGLTGNKRIVAFLKRYPGVFQVFETPEQGKLPCFQFSPEAAALCDEEVEIRKSMKVDAVTKLRKLLMMASEKRLLLGKIAHVAKDLGLPEDFRKRLVFKFPKYFRVVEGEDVTNEDFRVLELVKWSDRLAVTAEEEKVRATMKENCLDKPPRLEIQLPKRYRLSNKDKYVLYKFHELECPSPYESSSYLDPASAEAEKRAVLLIKELLSLTLEKRIYVDHLTHFRKEFKFSNQVRSLLIRHPEHFYVSRKGARDTVFLREAYQQIHVPGERQRHELKEKHALVVLKEKYFALMEVKRVQQSPDPQQEPVSQENEEESTQEEEGDQESASSMFV